MAELKGTEKFVAESLQSYFLKKTSDVSFEEGDDPPDIYLNIDGKKISVEITDIDQNVLKNRKTIDYGYLKFIVNLNKELGSFVDDKKLLIFFYHNYEKVSTISKRFKKYLKSIIEKNEYETGSHIENNINGVGFKISILEMPENGKKRIIGGAMPYGGKVHKSRDMNTVLETISDSNLSGQTLTIIQDRILDKNEKCKSVEKPVWLALYDNYYNKFTCFDGTEHLEHYEDIFKSIEAFGVFEKILVVFENGDVCEFNT